MTPVEPGHGFWFPLIDAGVPGEVTAVMVLQVKLVPHPFPAYTQMFPVLPLLPKLTLIVEVP
jgi:hypothetical protein